MTDRSSECFAVRLDKWLWAARFFKTRSLAAQEISKGRVHVNGQQAKASRDVRVNDLIQLRQTAVPRTVVVLDLSNQRGSAPVAQALYAETEESLLQRAEAARQRRDSPEPALSIEQGRPTKRDRRELVEWNRWSAAAESD